ncbi:MAG TPA: alpha/beta hydrolase [Chitinophagaceae bacterium]|nr:alpha/beta hydrolase [Chitinophagaceae bacterium]
MRKFLVCLFSISSLWILLAQYVIFKNRLSDSTAKSLFQLKHVYVRIYDTLIKDRNMHYAVSGSDSLPTLVFIHGSPGSWSNYRAFMWDSSLLKKYRIMSIDRPGFGYSDFGRAMHLQDQCRLIMPIIEKFSNGKALYLCGHSMGAPIALQLSASNPQLVSNLILVGAPLDVGLEEKETWRSVMGVKPLYYALPGAFGPSNTELLYLKTDLIGLQKEFKKVRAKVKFIHGDKDKRVPIANVAYGKKMLINAAHISCDTLFGAGHLIPWENEMLFRNLLLQME